MLLLVCLSDCSVDCAAHGMKICIACVQAEIVRNTCEIIHLLTDSNPIQVIVDAIINRWEPALVSPCKSLEPLLALLRRHALNRSPGYLRCARASGCMRAKCEPLFPGLLWIAHRV